MLNLHPYNFNRKQTIKNKNFNLTKILIKLKQINHNRIKIQNNKIINSMNNN